MDTPKTKPDMMAASPQLGGGKRILAALEHGGKPAAKPARAAAWMIDGWTAGLGLLLLLMLGAAWMMHEETTAPSPFKHRDGGAGDRSTPIAAAPRVEAAAVPAAGQAAAIVNESESPAVATQAPVSVSVSLAATQAGRAGMTAHTPPPQGAQAPHKPLPSGSGGASRTLQQTTTTTATTRNAPGSAARSGPANATTAARDTDVTLLTALVAHANKPTVTVAERSRDVVERKEGDTTAQLLARCQQLGLIEGMLCRSRICSDRWDLDAACRAPAH